MLNYLKAELYKLRRAPLVWIVSGGLLFLELWFVAGNWLTNSLDWGLADLVPILYWMFPAGFLLLLLPASAVFSEQHKHRTLKNEVNFGISRARVYLGKLLASLLTAGILCLLLLGVFLGSSTLLFGGWGDREALIPKLAELGKSLWLFLPLWMGALSLYHALQFTVKSATAAVLLYTGYFIVGEPIGALLATLGEKNGIAILGVLRWILFSAPMVGMHIPWAWLVGLGWSAATTAVGLNLFLRQDI